jgi:hypothetical protein
MSLMVLDGVGKTARVAAEAPLYEVMAARRAAITIFSIYRQKIATSSG